MGKFQLETVSTRTLAHFNATAEQNTGMWFGVPCIFLKNNINFTYPYGFIQCVLGVMFKLKYIHGNDLRKLTVIKHSNIS